MIWCYCSGMLAAEIDIETWFFALSFRNFYRRFIFGRISLETWDWGALHSCCGDVSRLMTRIRRRKRCRATFVKLNPRDGDKAAHLSLYAANEHWKLCALGGKMFHLCCFNVETLIKALSSAIRFALNFQQVLFHNWRKSFKEISLFFLLSREFMENNRKHLKLAFLQTHILST